MASGCKKDPVFQHTIAEKNKPWTDENFDKNTFTFAVFSDLTGGERPGIFDVAVAQLNLLRPELILCVGDLIEGDHENQEELHQQWDVFDSRTAKAKAPVFYVGGNHDLSGKEMQDTWEERYGRRYYHFIYKSVLFLILDTEDNTPERVEEIATARRKAIEILEREGEKAFAKTAYGQMPERTYGNIGQEQASYFEQVISEHPEVRHTFLFMHKAPWKFEADQNHFQAIEQALEGKSYTLFHGHEHAYAHEQRYGIDYIQLATTGGVQLDKEGRSADQIVLVTVDGKTADVANILLEGILDKTGHIPLGGDSLSFEKAKSTPLPKDSVH